MISGRPGVFISHSTCDRSTCGCLATRDAAVDIVEQAGCRPILDKRELHAGDDWHQRLLECLSDSRACIALLSPHAIESPYVYEELVIARILTNLAGVSFQLMPVLVGGTTRSQLKSSRLASLKLDALHMPRWTAPQPAPRDLTDVVDALHTAPPGFPATAVHDTVAHHLRPVDADLLRQIAELLHIDGAKWPPALPRTVAFGLLQERLLEASPDPLRLALKQLLRRIGWDGRAEVIDRVVPFARVPAAAAEQMRHVAARPSRRVAVLNATDDRIPRFYLRRASSGDDPWEHVTPGSGEPAAFVESVVADIRTVLEERLAFGVPVSDAAELDRLLRRHEDEQGPFVVLLRQSPDRDLADRLNAEFPRVVFVYITDCGAGAPDAVPIRALTPSQEAALIRLDGEMRKRFLHE